MITVQEVSDVLTQLGYNAKVQDSNHVLINNYILPDMLSQNNTSAILEIPANFPLTSIYGIMMPTDLFSNLSNKIKSRKVQINICGINWSRLSFNVKYNDNLNLYLSMHMFTTYRILSCERL